jgi:dienelactone hydrolase
MTVQRAVFAIQCVAWLGLSGIGFAACSSDPQQSVPARPTTPTASGGATAAPPAAQPMAPPAGMIPPAVANPMQPAAPAVPMANPVDPANPASPVGMEGAGVAGAAAPGMEPFVEPEYPDGELAGTCPDGFTPRSGMNTGFASDGKMRQFVTYLPSDMSSPRPVFVGITGTEQQSDAFISAAQLTSLTQAGWIVMAPVRLCTSEGRQQECLNGVGESTMDGWTWEPWNDGDATQETEKKWNDDPGQDVRFLENMVRCAATEWPIDQRRLYLGGISAGGSFTNRNLTFNSKFWAGGVPASGMWYITAGNDSVTADNADELMDGRCCHAPVQEIQMYSSIVIVLFGGPNDRYTTRGDMPIMVDYKPEAQAASNFYDSRDNVAVVTCQGSQGHIWPPSSAWNNWMAMTLASHPKGTPKADFTLPTPPAGYRCNVGRYTDLTF